MSEATAAPDELRTRAADTPDLPAGRVLAWVDRCRGWLLVTIVVLYAAGFTGRWRVAPDTALSMSLGRNLAEGNGFVYHGVKHNWFEPGLPLVIAGSFRLFGHDQYAAILAFMLACSLAALLLTYRLVLRHADRPTAVLVTVLTAVCETCLRYGFQVVTDTPFLVALLVYLIGYERLVGDERRDRLRWLGWPMLAAAVFLMALFRPTSITFVGAVALATAWHVLRGPGRLRHALIGALTVACLFAFRAVDPRRDSAAQPVAREQRLSDLLTTQRAFFLQRIVTETAPAFVEEILPEAVFGTEIAPGLDTLLSVAVMAAGLALARRRVLWGAWVAATFFQCMVWLPRERYILPVLPLLVYGLWLGAAWLSSRPRLSPRATSITLAGLLVLFVGPNLVYDLMFLVEQRHVGINRAGEGDPHVAAVREMAMVIRDRVGEQDVVFATAHRELSYFSRRRVEGSPWSYRWPRTEREEREFFERMRSVPAMYVVLPDTTAKPHIADLLGQLSMRTGEALATVERPAERDGRPVAPFTLHRLEPWSSTAALSDSPTTPATQPPR